MAAAPARPAVIVTARWESARFNKVIKQNGISPADGFFFFFFISIQKIWVRWDNKSPAPSRNDPFDYSRFSRNVGRAAGPGQNSHSKKAKFLCAPKPLLTQLISAPKSPSEGGEERLCSRFSFEWSKIKYSHQSWCTLVAKSSVLIARFRGRAPNQQQRSKI